MRKIDWLLSACLLASNLSLAAGQVQTPASIAEAARQFLNDSFAGQNAEVDIKLGKVDPRLRLKPCTEPLTGFIAQGTQLKGNTVVGIRCVGENAWHIYLPVKLSIMQPVWVFDKTLPKGHVIQRSDLKLEKRDTAQLRGAPITELTQILGARLKRQANSGQMASTGVACLVCKGERLKITVSGNRLSISMEGTALEDGFYGESIRVKNNTSKRTVDGMVIAKNQVAVSM